MFKGTSGVDMFPILGTGAATVSKSPGMLDSMSGTVAAAIENADMDGAALNSEIQSLRKFALALVFTLADSIVENDLADDELPTDRLDTLLAGIAAGVDDEDFEADQATLDIVIANVQDALATLGVSDELIAAIFSSDAEADEAIESAAEIIESNAPTGDDLEEFIDLFVYGEADEKDGEEGMLDGISIGKTTAKSGKFGKVVYKAVKAIRNGKVQVVNKRISGKVKLSAKQRSALNKARRKASSSGAIKKRMRSMKKAKALNI